MKWQGRTGLVVGVALVVAAGMVLPAKKVVVDAEVRVDGDAAEVVQEKSRPDAVPVSRPVRDVAPGVTP
ncbi:MAG: hypothetical protein ACK5DV_04210 [Planctomycetota bacterium]|jgi:hypothetical protein